MTEQSAPRNLVIGAVAVEDIAFDFAVSGDKRIARFALSSSFPREPSALVARRALAAVAGAA